MCSQQQADVDFYEYSAVRRWQGSPNIFPPSFAILFPPLTVMLYSRRCGSYARLPTSRQDQHGDQPTDLFIKWQLPYSPSYTPHQHTAIIFLYKNEGYKNLHTMFP
jgi:hypothetical protein